MPSPADVLASMVASDSGRPRLTCYDDAPGPTQGERVELSARVLANWVAKAANLLQDDLDAAPATTLGIDLPAHWRAAYWALAAWSVGATVVAGPQAGTADVLVTDRAETARAEAEERHVILVTMPMLARGNPATPYGAVDEARELARHGDVFAPWEEPSEHAAALVTPGFVATYADVVVRRPEWGATPRVRVRDDLVAALTDSLSAWASDGSVVLVREPSGDQAARLATEGVTVDLSAGRR